MAFSSVHDMIDLCKESGKPLYEVILESDLAESGLTRAESEAEMHRLWAVMQATSDGYCGADRSMSGFAGGDAAKVNAAAVRGVLYADGYFADVMAEALKTAECNACMKRIVAAPTAGSCGVLPAVLLPLRRRGLADEAAVHRALYIAAGFGQVVAARATLAGAEGGCQAEVGAASGMAAAALVDIKGGTAEQCAEAFAMALTNLEGLVCDPVAGLVEIPCIKRNVIGAMNAVSAADMALAGVVGHIPADEVIDAMAEVGNAMSKDPRDRHRRSGRHPHGPRHLRDRDDGQRGRGRLIFYGGKPAGTQHRSHCPNCLTSLHLDNEPGDRAADCGGQMEPVAVWVRKGGEWAIIHRCRLCGKLTSNRIAADDNPMLLMSIAMRPLCTPPFPLERIEEMTALMGGEGRIR